MEAICVASQKRKKSSFFDYCLGFRALVLTILFSFSEIKSVEPVTLIVIGAGAVVIRKASRTTAGKVLLGYALARAAQTSSGKRLIAQAQGRAEIMLKQKSHDGVMKIRDGLSEKALVFRARIAKFAESFLKLDSEQTLKAVRNLSQRECSSYQNFGISEVFKNIKKSLIVSKNEPCGPVFLEKNQKFGKEINFEKTFSTYEPNNFQEVHVCLKPTFPLSSKKADESDKKQFWKGACVGVVTGAAVMAWLDNEREKQFFSDYFNE